MLSVAESANILGVSPARVRALISKGILPAEKAGRAWLLREEDVMQRLSHHAKAGRPHSNRRMDDREDRIVCNRNSGYEHNREHAQTSTDHPRSDEHSQDDNHTQLHELYRTCKEAFRFRPDAELLAQAENAEEAAFYVAVADFFLQQRQKQIVKQGVY